MRNWIRIATLGLALVATTGFSCCVVTSPGVGVAGTTYMLGHLDGILSATPQKVVQAAKSVLEEQEMKAITADSTALDGKVSASTALDTKIEMTVTRQDDSASKISIRVGTFGDRQVSIDLYEKIKAKLP